MSNEQYYGREAQHLLVVVLSSDYFAVLVSVKSSIVESYPSTVGIPLMSRDERSMWNYRRHLLTCHKPNGYLLL